MAGLGRAKQAGGPSWPREESVKLLAVRSIWFIGERPSGAAAGGREQHREARSCWPKQRGTPRRKRSEAAQGLDSAGQAVVRAGTKLACTWRKRSCGGREEQAELSQKEEEQRELLAVACEAALQRDREEREQRARQGRAAAMPTSRTRSEADSAKEGKRQGPSKAEEEELSAGAARRRG